MSVFTSTQTSLQQEFSDELHTKILKDNNIKDVTSPWDKKTFTQENGLYSHYQNLLQKIPTLERQPENREQLLGTLQEISVLHELFEKKNVREYSGFFGWLKTVFSIIFREKVKFRECILVENPRLKTVEQVNNEIATCAKELFGDFAELSLQQDPTNTSRFSYKKGERTESCSFLSQTADSIFQALRGAKAIATLAAGLQNIAAEQKQKKQMEEENRERFSTASLSVDNVNEARELVVAYKLVPEERKNSLVFLAKESAGEQYIFYGVGAQRTSYADDGQKELKELKEQARTNKDLFEKAKLYKEKKVPADLYVDQAPKEPGCYWLEARGDVHILHIRTEANEYKPYRLNVLYDGVELTPLDDHCERSTGEPIRKQNFEEFTADNGLLSAVKTFKDKREELETEQEEKRQRLEVQLNRYEADCERIELEETVDPEEAKNLIEKYGLLSRDEAEKVVFLKKESKKFEVPAEGWWGLKGLLFSEKKQESVYVFRKSESVEVQHVQAKEEKLSLYEAADKARQLYEEAKILDEVSKKYKIDPNAFATAGIPSEAERKDLYRGKYWIEITRPLRPSADPIEATLRYVQKDGVEVSCTLVFGSAGITVKIKDFPDSNVDSFKKLRFLEEYNPLTGDIRKEEQLRSTLQERSRNDQQVREQLEKFVGEYIGESSTGYQLVTRDDGEYIQRVTVQPTSRLEAQEVGKVRIQVDMEDKKAKFSVPNDGRSYAQFEDWLDQKMSLSQLREAVFETNKKVSEYKSNVSLLSQFLKEENEKNRDFVLHEEGARDLGWVEVKEGQPEHLYLQKMGIQNGQIVPLEGGENRKEILLKPTKDKVRFSLNGEGEKLYDSFEAWKTATNAQGYEAACEEAQKAFEAGKQKTIADLCTNDSLVFRSQDQTEEIVSSSRSVLRPAMVQQKIVPSRFCCIDTTNTATPSLLDVAWDDRQRAYMISPYRITCSRPGLYTIENGQYTLDQLKNKYFSEKFGVDALNQIAQHTADLLRTLSVLDKKAWEASLQSETASAVNEQAGKGLNRIIWSVGRQQISGPTKEKRQFPGAVGSSSLIERPILFYKGADGDIHESDIFCYPDGSLGCEFLEGFKTESKEIPQALEELKKKLCERGPEFPIAR